MLSHIQIICIGIIASLAAGLATSVGAIPIFFTRNISERLMDALLGMAAGIMLAATAFSLIIPAIEKGGGGIKGASITLIGILVGGIFLDVIDRLFPDTNLLSNSMNDAENENGAALRRVWLFVIAITVHNFPEGMAVGVGFGDGDIANGISLAIAIGLQNIPEGLAVALPLLQHGYSTGKTFLTALATGLVEPIGGLIGVCIIQLSRPLLPFIMAFAAGAMLFVITEEIIPEIHNHQYCSKLATHALLIGFVIMMFLDNVLG